MPAKLSMDKLRKLHGLIGVLNREPSTWDIEGLPEDLLVSWKNYIRTKKELNEVLTKYDIELLDV